jgi:hypothetical protein
MPTRAIVSPVKSVTARVSAAPATRPDDPSEPQRAQGASHAVARA